jgi:hypothetical protein
MLESIEAEMFLKTTQLTRLEYDDQIYTAEQLSDHLKAVAANKY